jgi:hypothetical protein
MLCFINFIGAMTSRKKESEDKEKKAPGRKKRRKEAGQRL